MNPKSLMLVEDNPSDIRLTQKALEISRIANELIVVRDGQEALDYLFFPDETDNRSLRPLPALILLDIKLPKVDGIEVLRRIRENPRTHRIPVVILTASREEQDLAMGYDLGVNSYIQKPVDFDQFIQAVQQLGMYWLVMNEIPPQVRI